MPFLEFRYFSSVLQKHTAANLILPKQDMPRPYHALLLLHGLSDDHTIWSRRTSVERYVENLPLIVVMPDGGRGFYVDAEQGYAYGSALGEELPRLLEGYFRIDGGWCASGLSMGGYGALRLAFAYPDRFRSACSHSGAVGFGTHPEYLHDEARGEEFRRLLGDDPRGGPNDLYALAARMDPSQRPVMRFDCGVDDYLLGDNRAFHAHLEAAGVPHEYEEHPGGHDWEYWDRHVADGIRFHGGTLGF
jgi:putative tributyrin esterase